MNSYQVQRKPINDIQGDGIIKTYAVGETIKLSDEQARVYADRIVLVENGKPVERKAHPPKPVVSLLDNKPLSQDGPGMKLRAEEAAAQSEAESVEEEEAEGDLEPNVDSPACLPETLGEIGTRAALAIISSCEDVPRLRNWQIDTRSTIQSALARRLRALSGD